MPNSPRFLLSRGRDAEALQALAWLRGADADIRWEFQQIQDNVQRQVREARVPSPPPASLPAPVPPAVCGRGLSEPRLLLLGNWDASVATSRCHGLTQSSASGSLPWPTTDPGAWHPGRVPWPVPWPGLFPGEGKRESLPRSVQPRAGWCPLAGGPGPLSTGLVSPEQPHVVGRGPGPPRVPAHLHRRAHALPAAADGHHARAGLPSACLQQHGGAAGESHGPPASVARTGAGTAGAGNCVCARCLFSEQPLHAKHVLYSKTHRVTEKTSVSTRRPRGPRTSVQSPCLSLRGATSPPDLSFLACRVEITCAWLRGR